MYAIMQVMDNGEELNVFMGTFEQCYEWLAKNEQFHPDSMFYVGHLQKGSLMYEAYKDQIEGKE